MPKPKHTIVIRVFEFEDKERATDVRDYLMHHVAPMLVNEGVNITAAVKTSSEMDAALEERFMLEPSELH